MIEALEKGTELVLLITPYVKEKKKEQGYSKVAGLYK
jgi:hypothetical protein